MIHRPELYSTISSFQKIFHENRNNNSIDSTVGGNGDVWMRLQLICTSALKPEFQFHIKVPGFL
jgi:hypothetical protein